MPIFSVIIPTFNREQFLKKAVGSVLAQSFKDFELIIIDDGSKDKTRALIEQFSDKRIHYVFQDNQGVAAARNRGLKHSKGEWVAFLDSDDCWVKSKLQETKHSFDQFPDIKIFHSEEKWFRCGQMLNPKKEHKKPDGNVYKNALALCCISISTAVIHKSVFEDFGNFDESLPACEDYDFWLRATHKYPVKLIEQYLTEKDGGRDDQLSSQWGLDRFRIKSLDKMLQSNQLDEENYSLTLSELKKKAAVYIQGCTKRNKKEEALEYQAILDKYLKVPT